MANNRLVVRRLLIATLVMFGFGFAMVPLYDVFCEVTGLNGKTNSAAASAEGMAVNPQRLVTVEFIASVNRGLPWEFRPVAHKLQVHPGESITTEYYARNVSGREITGNAVPSVSPSEAASHFRKIECFCFTEQTLAAGEDRQMPVTFVVDPELSEDVKTVTLSYTFFAKPGTAAEVAGGELESLGGMPAMDHSQH